MGGGAVVTDIFARLGDVMIEEIDEFRRAPDRSGSAKRIRSGRRFAAAMLGKTNQKPLWRRQLRQKKRKPAISLSRS